MYINYYQEKTKVKEIGEKLEVSQAEFDVDKVREAIKEIMK